MVVSDVPNLSRDQLLLVEELERLVDRMGQNASSTKHSDQKPDGSSKQSDQPPQYADFSPMTSVNSLSQKELDAIKPGLQLFNVCGLMKAMPGVDWLHPCFSNLDGCREAVENDVALAECIGNCTKDDKWDPLFSESIHRLYRPI